MAFKYLGLKDNTKTSLLRTPVNTSATITGISQANTAQITVVGHGFSANEQVVITGVSGMTQINNQSDIIGSVDDADHVTLSNIDSSGYSAYTSGGTLRRIFTTLNMGSLTGNQVVVIYDDTKGHDNIIDAINRAKEAICQAF